MTELHDDTPADLAEPARPVTAICPRILRARGGYLALCPDDHPWRIGVFGTEESEARLRFEAAVQLWADLAQRPDPVRT